MIRTITFEAYYYVDVDDGLPLERSERQDVTFTLHGDSVSLVLPPPAARTLYLTASPRMFVQALAGQALK